MFEIYNEGVVDIKTYKCDEGYCNDQDEFILNAQELLFIEKQLGSIEI